MDVIKKRYKTKKVNVIKLANFYNKISKCNTYKNNSSLKRNNNGE